MRLPRTLTTALSTVVAIPFLVTYHQSSPPREAPAAGVAFAHRQVFEAASRSEERSAIDDVAKIKAIEARLVTREAHHRAAVARHRARVRAEAHRAALAAAPAPIPTPAAIPPVWAALAQCEAGGDWHLDTGNGFLGGVQFTQGTYNAYGGEGSPAAASPATQIAVARRVLTTGWGSNPPQGVNAWPVCGPEVGLSPGD